MRALILGSSLALGSALAAAVPPAAAVAQTAPSCVPTSIDNSALQPGGVTLSPLPGSRDASPRTQVSFLGVPAAEITNVTVTGTETGLHSGHLRAYSQGDGASFVPSHPFAEGERVTVKAKLHVGGAVQNLFDEFGVAKEDVITDTARAVTLGASSQIQSFQSRSDLKPPVVTVTADSPSIAPGYEFVAPYAGPGQAGPMIVEPDGSLVWFKPLPRYTSATNFRVQAYQGKPVLTWWQGRIIVHGFGRGEDVIANGDYADVAHVRAGNGHQADLHEFQLTPQGTALLTAYYPILCNISSVGGPSYGAVTDGVVQEIDVKTGLVMYEWTSLDHVALSASYAPAKTTSTRFPFDFFHINSINLDRDGSLLVGSRNTWTAYDLNSQTGQIVWQLGGKHSTFAESANARTAWQHDPREIAEGVFSIFDNGSSPTVHSQSRGIVLQLNSQASTASLVAELTHTPSLVAESQGNLQALGNGDWFLGWGQEPFFTELSGEGKLLYEAHLPPKDQSYRDFRFAWTGTPEHPPTFAFKPVSGGGGTVYASWNGATLVTSWRVVSGRTRTSLNAVASAARAGFETQIKLPASTVGPYVAVQAYGAAGQLLGTSTVASETGLG
jgi:Arylsulfotransferase (ASST)